MIDLHYWPTPNGKKVTILLEECGMPYKIVPVNIGRGDQFTKEFLEMNPNHRMPVMVDHEPKGGGKPIVIFESGAIMMYIAEKAGKFYPTELRARYEVNEWLIWQMANQGPKSGECGHFRRVDQAKEQKHLALQRGGELRLACRGLEKAAAHDADAHARAQRAQADHEADADAGGGLDHGDHLKLVHSFFLSVYWCRG